MSPLTVDIHSHLYPRSYIELLKARTEIPRIVGEPGDERFIIFPEEDTPRGGRPMDREYWDVGAKLGFMERFGIDQTVVSLGNPWLDPLSEAESIEAARALNKELAGLRAETLGRIVALGVLPSGPISAAVEVAGEVAEAPDLVGLVTGPRICGSLLDDNELEPIWEMLETSRLPLLIHPHYAAAIEELRGFGHAFPVSMGFPFETTIAIARLVFAGVLHRHPGLRIVGSHGGGTLPFLAARLDAGWRSDPSTQTRLPHPPSSDLARLFLDCVLYHPRAMKTAADLVGVGKMGFGTDHPFSVADPEANLAGIAAAFNGGERELVLGRAARSLFGLPELAP